MITITYSPAYVRADGSVWCIQEDAENGMDVACRLAVDLESGSALYLPETLVDLYAPHPMSHRHREVWPWFQWAVCRSRAPGGA
jgi:hypothetical protein